MPDSSASGRDCPFDPVAATAAGLAAGVAFLLAMEADLRLTGNNADDRIVLGRPFVPDHPKRAKPIGTAVHLANSVGFAWLYASLQHRLPGPPWLRGTLFFNLENFVLYPVTIWEDHHPAIRDGQVDRYLTWLSFAQSIPRHVAYGAVLGSLYVRLACLSPQSGS